MLKAHYFIRQQSGAGQDRLLIKDAFGRLVIAVADGAGGTSGGAEAADLAISMVDIHVEDLRSEPCCVSLLKEIDSATARASEAGETTIVVVVIENGRLFGASVGDSGAWLASSAQILDLTEGQIRKPMIGSSCAIPVGFSHPQTEGRLLVASDGLLKYTSREAIQEVLRTHEVETSPETLARLVQLRSGAFPDDISIVVVGTKP